MASASRSRGLWSSFSLSVLLHLALVAIVAGAVLWMHEPKPREQRLGIEGHVVTSIATAPLPQPPPEPVPEEQPPPEPVPDAAAEQAAQAERAAQEQRVAEERRLAEEAQATERKAQEEAERRKTEQAARDKAEREKVEREKQAREKAERDKREREKQLEQARARRESELNAQIAAEERVAAARASGLMAQYLGQIANRVERAWNRPGSLRPGLECEVHVTQVPGGAVTNVTVGRCNGDESVRQSIKDAVYRASPLPQPPDPALFDRDLKFTFRPLN